MHAVNLISAALRHQSKGKSSSFDVPELPCAPVEGICAITGARGACLPRKELISGSFCDHASLKAPDSDLVSVDCFIAWRFGSREEGKKRDMRPEANQCWVCTPTKFSVIKRQEVRKIVLEGMHEKPWAIWVTTSYKKHGSLRARVNNDWRGFVAFDELLVDCRGADAVQYWTRMTAAQNQGIWRSMQETLDCPPGMVMKIGLENWLSFERWARPRFRSPLYQLMCYLLPSKEEMANGV